MKILQVFNEGLCNGAGGSGWQWRSVGFRIGLRLSNPGEVKENWMISLAMRCGGMNAYV